MDHWYVHCVIRIGTGRLATARLKHVRLTHHGGCRSTTSLMIDQENVPKKLISIVKTLSCASCGFGRTNVFSVVDPWNDVFCSLRCDRTCAEKTVSVQIYNRVPAFNTHLSKWLVVPNYKFANPGATMLWNPETPWAKNELKNDSFCFTVFSDRLEMFSEFGN